MMEIGWNFILFLLDMLIWGLFIFWIWVVICAFGFKLVVYQVRFWDFYGVYKLKFRHTNGIHGGSKHMQCAQPHMPFNFRASNIDRY